MADAVVAAIDLAMRRNDCHVLSAEAGGDADADAAAALAHAVARRTGLSLMLRVDDRAPGGVRLATASVLPKLGRACGEHPPHEIEDAGTSEAYMPIEGTGSA